MLLIVSFNLFNYFVCLFEVTAPPSRTGQQHLRYSTAPGSAARRALGMGPGGGSPRGPFCFSLPPSLGGGRTRGSKRVGRGLRLSRL